MAALDAEAEGEDEDKVAITFGAIKDGSVDLLLVLGFDRDIYSKNMQYRADQDDGRREGVNRREAFISQEFKAGLRGGIRDSFVDISTRQEAKTLEKFPVDKSVPNLSARNRAARDIPKPLSVSMDIDYNIDTTHAVADESILIKESSLHNQTILDYRDFMARQHAKNNSILMHEDAFIIDQGLSELTA